MYSHHSTDRNRHVLADPIAMFARERQLQLLAEADARRRRHEATGGRRFRHRARVDTRAV